MTMMSMDSRRLFEQAFDTFKAFDSLTVVSSSAEQQVFPASIWQILQHLLVWQAHQLAQLRGLTSAEAFNEKRSWDAVRVPPSETALQAAVSQFKNQLVELQSWASEALGDAQKVLLRGLILQEVALHLSFHLGEVVLMRRLQGSYPLPAHMSEFLQA
jgi:conjugal transfer/entry exclusion protein